MINAVYKKREAEDVGEENEFLHREGQSVCVLGKGEVSTTKCIE